MKPVSPNPARNAATRAAESSSDRLPRNPTTGIVGCCARATHGHAVAPPSSVMNSRRLMPDMGLPSPRTGDLLHHQPDTHARRVGLLSHHLFPAVAASRAGLDDAGVGAGEPVTAWA